MDVYVTYTFKRINSLKTKIYFFKFANVLDHKNSKRVGKLSTGRRVFCPVGKIAEKSSL